MKTSFQIGGNIDAYMKCSGTKTTVQKVGHPDADKNIGILIICMNLSEKSMHFSDGSGWKCCGS